MTKKKPKISYRDLLATSPDAAPSIAPPAAPPVAPPAAPPGAPSPVDLAVVLNPGLTHQVTPAAGVHVVIPEPVAAMVRALTPRQARAAVVPPVAPASTTPIVPAPMAVPARVRATRATRALRATVAGRVVLASALRELLAERGSAELLRFRVGRERFALRLAEVEEAVESPELHPIPEAPREMLGVVALRGRLVPVYAPARALGVRLDTPSIALVLAGLVRPIGIAVDDVEDVFTMAAAALRPAPGTDDPDGVLLGVTRHGRRLVSVLDGAALAAACTADLAPETA
ncbi:MAG: purine-binding chemotaxis protein CheW [Gemmatimonadetes bacterium]|nr:purine-binding chemotaxis protein CheW [Gemmatimonadota bacterium]